jgi:hypothetical protein
MSNRTAFLGFPVLITHWDADLYPTRPLPFVPELVIQILAHGEIWLKEVDLFLNTRIAASLSDPVVFDQFSSLLATKRVKVLIPDKSRNLDDPDNHPILSAATERLRGKRPLKSRQWEMTDKDKRLCEKLDSVLVANGGLKPDGVVRQRVEPPAEKNVFAATLIEVLNGPDKRWRGRRQFKGINQCVADQFSRFAENHELALDLLRSKGITPNATNGFYRSLLYQCADHLLPKHQRRPVKNLGQSVYAHCELDREKVVGTYHGSRVAELPPTDKVVPPDEHLFRIEVVPAQTPIKIPVAGNIGDIVSAVVEDCDDSMRRFWAIAGGSPSPDLEFRVAWEAVAAAFAEHYVDAHPCELSSRDGAVWTIGEYLVRAAEIVDEKGRQLGAEWVPDFGGDSWMDKALSVVRLAAYVGPTMEYIRRGRADLEKGKIRQVLLDAATARCGPVV